MRWLAAAGLLLASAGATAQTPGATAQTPGAAAPATAKPGPRPFEIDDTDAFRVTFVKLGAEDREGLLFEPKARAASPIGLVFTYPRTKIDMASTAAELATRGYRVLITFPYAEHETPFDGVPETSAGIAFLRGLPGVARVVIGGHSAGGRMIAFYADIALNGPAACQHPGILYPCRTEQASGLEKPDGVILLDPAPGALNAADTVDPAFAGDRRTRNDLDMYAAANGFDAATGRATYAADFKRRYFAAQSARNMTIIDDARARLKQVEAGKGDYAGDAPFVVRGVVDNASGAALFQADLTIHSHTKRPHLLLKPDGTARPEILRSIRGANAGRIVKTVDSLGQNALNYSLRYFLAKDAIRTTPDFAMTEDDVLGIDWRSAMSSTPGSAEGITVPTLILTMTCFQLVVTSEIAYDHLAAKDKTLAAVEGALHGFSPCRPEFGDTNKKTFDFVAAWLAKPGRF